MARSLLRLALALGLLGLLALALDRALEPVSERPIGTVASPLEAVEPVRHAPWSAAPVLELPAPERAAPRDPQAFLTIEVARGYANGHFGARGRASVREGRITLLGEHEKPVGRTEVYPDGTWSFLSPAPIPAPRELRAVLEDCGTRSETVRTR